MTREYLKDSKALKERIKEIENSGKDVLATSVVNLTLLVPNNRLKYRLLLSIRRAFKRSEYTVQDFAEALEVNRSTMSSVLSLNYKRHSLDLIYRIYERKNSAFNEKSFADNIKI